MEWKKAVAYDRGLISRNAKVFSLSKTFIAGISPVLGRQSGYLSEIRVRSMQKVCSVYVPLMILQKMQFAACAAILDVK